MTPAYRYRASLIRVIDGDTYVLDVDLGFTVHAHVTVRLRGLDTPERHTPAGQRAAAAARDYLIGQPILVESHKGQQTFARWVADLYVPAGAVADLLRADGHIKD